jgi:hypothetical protein
VLPLRPSGAAPCAAAAPLHTASLAVRLEAVVRHDRVRVSVYDDAPDADPHPQPGDTHAENGRGLLLVTGLARDWGVHRGERHGGTPGKRVWFELGGPGSG